MNVKSKDDGGIVSCHDSAEDYDHSPTVYLSDAQVSALGLKSLPKPGTVFALEARAVVSSVSASDYKGDGSSNANLSFRLTAMAIEAEKPDNATMLYGS